MITLANTLRRAFGRPVPLRPGYLQWVARNRLRCCLYEPGELQECAEIEVLFTATGLREQEILLTLADVDGDPVAVQWYERNADFLLDLHDEHVAEHPTGAEVSA